MMNDDWVISFWWLSSLGPYQSNCFHCLASVVSTMQIHAYEIFNIYVTKES